MFFNTAFVVSACILGLAVGESVPSSVATEDLNRHLNGPARDIGNGQVRASGGGGGRPVDRFGVLGEEKTRGWTDVPNSIFHRFHDYVALHMSTIIPKFKVQPRELQWGCTDAIVVPITGTVYKIRSCLALVFIYRCKPCKSAGQEEMVGTLLTEGWRSVPCGGFFDLDEAAPSHDHAFSAFYHEFESTPDSSTTLSLVIGEETEFMFWGQIHKTTVMCSQQMDETDCVSGDCFWDDLEGVCMPKVCPQGGTGQPPAQGGGKKGPGKSNAVGPGAPQCPVCVHDEDSLLP